MSGKTRVIAPHLLSDEELVLLQRLRDSPPAKNMAVKRSPSLGERLADALTSVVGSWHFIIIQTLLLLVWIAANVWAWLSQWDPYPFILLNLVLSFQAAYTAPIIMMSQNRQAAVDRLNAETDYKVNVKAELEIELLHQKIDLLREQEIADLTRLISNLQNTLSDKELASV
jgi:uncharacterized membrane protein